MCVCASPPCADALLHRYAPALRPAAQPSRLSAQVPPLAPPPQCWLKKRFEGMSDQIDSLFKEVGGQGAALGVEDVQD